MKLEHAAIRQVENYASSEHEKANSSSSEFTDYTLSPKSHSSAHGHHTLQEKKVFCMIDCLPLCIMVSGNILASENLCFRVLKVQLKVINKNVCYLYSVWVNQIN